MPFTVGERIEMEVYNRELPDEFRDAERAKRELTYTQLVGVAIGGFIALYTYMHEAHDVKASDVPPAQREEKADHAVKLALEMQRGMMALIGTHRRRTYAHDLVYGMHQLYKLFAKPWNAATEGSEHGHQKMKKFFHHLCCHNGKGEHGSCYEVLRLEHVEQQLLREYAWEILPHSEYAAQRSGKVLGELSSNQTPPEPQRRARGGTKRKHRFTGSVKGEKKYKADTKMEDLAAAIKTKLVDQYSV